MAGTLHGNIVETLHATSLFYNAGNNVVETLRATSLREWYTCNNNVETLRAMQ